MLKHFKFNGFRKQYKFNGFRKQPYICAYEGVWSNEVFTSSLELTYVDFLTLLVHSPKTYFRIKVCIVRICFDIVIQNKLLLNITSPQSKLTYSGIYKNAFWITDKNRKNIQKYPKI